jgi:membrane protein YqaA with SNARE-associated domain
MNKKKLVLAIIKSLVLLITVLAIASVFYGTIFYNQIKESMVISASNFGSQIFFSIGFLLELIPQYITPYLAILIAAITGKDIWLACFAVMAGGIVGSTVGFFLGKKYGYEAFEDWFGKDKIGRVKKGLNHSGKWFVTLSAMSPIPYVPILYGSLEMSWNKFIIYGVIPRAMSYIVITLMALISIKLGLNFFHI